MAKATSNSLITGKIPEEIDFDNELDIFGTVKT